MGVLDASIGHRRVVEGNAIQVRTFQFRVDQDSAGQVRSVQEHARQVRAGQVHGQEIRFLEIGALEIRIHLQSKGIVYAGLAR